MSWIDFKEVDFSDGSIMAYHVDTRDFHVSTNDYEPKINMSKVNKSPDKYYHTPEEIKILLNRYFEESGGKATWRMFSLSGEAKTLTEGWQMKYIRIYRRNEGLLICIEQVPMSKQLLAYKVNQKYLHAH